MLELRDRGRIVAERPGAFKRCARDSASVRAGKFGRGFSTTIDTSRRAIVATVRFERHLFVCTQARPGGGTPSCGARGGSGLVAALERGLAARADLAARVAVTGCACLGPCFDGPNAVVYPDGVWYAGLTEDDADDLLAHLAGGPPVARRVYAWPRDDD
jgi:(2Fe-2S) ferredoxin